MRLYDVSEKLSVALDSRGYSEKSYYVGPPDGFALVTKLEQFSEDGASKKPPDRWATDVTPLREFSLKAYLQALFKAEPGYYRVIVFAVTPDEVDPDEKKTATREAAMDWVKGGANKLPESVGSRRYTKAYTTTALVYEFVQPGRGKDPAFRKHSPLLAKDHLVKARIWGALGRLS
jgi:hypothetical protein